MKRTIAAALLIAHTAAAQEGPDHELHLFVECSVAYAKSHRENWPSKDALTARAIAECSEHAMEIHRLAREAELQRLRQWSDQNADSAERAEKKADAAMAAAIKEARAAIAREVGQ